MGPPHSRLEPRDQAVDQRRRAGAHAARHRNGAHAGDERREPLVPAAGITEFPQCGGIRSIGVFCAAPAPYLELVRWAVSVALVIVASGWRPRITALPHWWIAFSLQANALVIEGGDQVASIWALLLLPVALTDRRRWHWKEEAEALAPSERRTFARVLAGVLLFAIRIQVAGIDLHAAAGKISVSEWADGTVLYYWLTDPVFGAPRWLWPFVETVLAHPAVAVVTWSVLVLEIALALGLGVDKRWRGILLALGISFHFGIALLIGLPSFGLAMTAALILYLRPTERPFSFR